MSPELQRMLQLAGVGERQLNEASPFGHMASQLAALPSKEEREKQDEARRKKNAAADAKEDRNDPDKTGAGTSSKSMEKSTGRGRKRKEGTDKFISWMQSNPNATRKEAIAYGASIGWVPAHVNTIFYRYKPKKGSGPVNEFWLVVNKSNGLVLSEGSLGIMPSWVDYEDAHTIDAEIFVTEQEALNVARRLDIMGTPSVIMCSSFLQEADSDEEEDTEEDEDKDDKSKDDEDDTSKESDDDKDGESKKRLDDDESAK